jgi:acyl carrier protein
MNGVGSTVQRIRKVIGRFAEVDPAAVPMQARLRGYGVDSIRVIDLLISIEEEFGIDLDLEEMSRIATVQELAEYVNNCRHGVRGNGA